MTALNLEQRIELHFFSEVFYSNPNINVVADRAVYEGVLVYIDPKNHDIRGYKQKVKKEIESLKYRFKPTQVRIIVQTINADDSISGKLIRVAAFIPSK